MYKFPKDLNLSHLLQCEICEISIVPFNLAIRTFEPPYNINITGDWKLFDSDGKTYDEGNGTEAHTKTSYKIQVLVQKKITGYKVLNPETLELSFNNGFKLHIYDFSEKYETVHISPNIYI